MCVYVCVRVCVCAHTDTYLPITEFQRTWLYTKIKTLYCIQFVNTTYKTDQFPSFSCPRELLTRGQLAFTSTDQSDFIVMKQVWCKRTGPLPLNCNLNDKNRIWGKTVELTTAESSAVLWTLVLLVKDSTQWWLESDFSWFFLPPSTTKTEEESRTQPLVPGPFLWGGAYPSLWSQVLLEGRGTPASGPRSFLMWRGYAAFDPRSFQRGGVVRKQQDQVPACNSKGQWFTNVGRSCAPLSTVLCTVPPLGKRQTPVKTSTSLVLRMRVIKKQQAQVLEQ